MSELSTRRATKGIRESVQLGNFFDLGSWTLAWLGIRWLPVGFSHYQASEPGSFSTWTVVELPPRHQIILQTPSEPIRHQETYDIRPTLFTQ